MSVDSPRIPWEPSSLDTVSGRWGPAGFLSGRRALPGTGEFLLTITRAVGLRPSSPEPEGA